MDLVVETERREGRPTIYSDELAAVILTRLAQGESLRSVCRDPLMPSHRCILAWVNGATASAPKTFASQYAEARALGAEYRFDGLREIASDESRTVPRATLMVHTEQWALARQYPHLYGDKQTVTHDVSDDLAERLDRARERSSGTPVIESEVVKRS